MKSKKKLILWLIFISYSLMLIYFLFFNGRNADYNYSYTELFNNRTNFVPFRYIRSYSKQLLSGNFHISNVINLIGNIAVFVPLGAMLPLVFKKLRTFRRFAIVTPLLPLSIECLQFIAVVGCFDVDDIILNIIGLLIGYAAYRLISRISDKL